MIFSFTGAGEGSVTVVLGGDESAFESGSDTVTDGASGTDFASFRHDGPEVLEAAE
jgi:hypothetical protein